MNLGREAESLAIYAEIVAQSPQNCAALLGLGKSKVWAGLYEEALVYLDRAHNLCPRDLDIRYARAQALSFKGNRSQAQAELHEIEIARAALTRAGELASEVLMHPDHFEARLEMIGMHQDLGRQFPRPGERRSG
ncbi:MAG: hypothetical protein HY290_09935, partial [Planctomycetia bacterium]|nr:hypothetical protein [Planctomycetia bacterium]